MPYYPYAPSAPRTVPLRVAQRLQLERDEALAALQQAHERLRLQQKQMEQHQMRTSPEQQQELAKLKSYIQELHEQLEELLAQREELEGELDLMHEQVSREAEEQAFEDEPTSNQSVTSLMHVRDSIARALSASDDSTNPWHQGLVGIQDQVDAELQAFGATLFAQVGEAFDPRVHEAIGVTTNTVLPQGTIVEVVRHGVRVEDKVIATAQVVVAK